MNARNPHVIPGIEGVWHTCIESVERVGEHSRARGPSSYVVKRSFYIMHIPRRYTVEGQDPFAALRFVPRVSRIVNPDGSVVFEMKDVLAPEGWSQVAVDVLAQKYFRKAGVPPRTERVPESGVPSWLQRSRPLSVVSGPLSDAENTSDKLRITDHGPRTTDHETDARQVFRRMAGCWTYW